MEKFKRAVVMAVGSGGDVAPLAAVAEKLAAHGMDTTLMAPQRYRRFTAGTAVQFQSIGADDVFEEVFNGADVWSAAKGLQASWRYYGAAMRTGLSALRRGWHAADTLLVSSSFAVAARLAEELDAYRNTTVHLSPSIVFSAHRPPKWPAASIPGHWPLWLKRVAIAAAERCGTDPVIGAHVNAFRAELGLPPVRKLFSQWIHSPRRVVYAFPEWFAQAAPDWPAHGAFTGFPSCPQPQRALPAALEAFLQGGSGPVMVITAGTAVASRPQWVERLASFAVAQGARVVVIEPNAQGDTAGAAVHSVPFAPFDLLLPRVQLIAHHAGIGTMAEALRAGLPQLLVPSAHDQPDNAWRLQHLGLGHSLGQDPGPGDLTRAWHWALGNGPLRQALHDAQARIAREEEGAGCIAELVLADCGARDGQGSDEGGQRIPGMRRGGDARLQNAYRYKT
ncbi:MAG TPA: glycosyltransferase [Noviherbaspirillum sp.]|uniref:glycosyltransferase n=1 Tax=Noviherbaspirillum sp. TaxID=1926288 RepID=UPI002D5C2742|nr:glycosyltransferase [Noviherbaspirillum sp.]HYD94669.1 glycosyltransferase [Noviherbaspirillum sp.]